MPSLAVKPPRAAVHLELIPPEMKAVPQWLGWNWTKNDKGLFSKPPFSIHTARQCDKTDREQHATFDQAAAAVERFDGLGFAFTPTMISCSSTWTSASTPGTWKSAPTPAMSWSWPTATPRSRPSGTGLKIYIIAKMPDGYRHQDEAKGFEVYHQGAYSCVTGNHFANAPATIRTCAPATCNGCWTSCPRRRSPSIGNRRRTSRLTMKIWLVTPCLPSARTMPTATMIG